MTTTTVYSRLDSAITTVSQFVEGLSRLILSQDVMRDRNALKTSWEQAVNSVDQFFNDGFQPVPPVVHPVGVVAFRLNEGTGGHAVAATPVVTEVQHKRTASVTCRSTEYGLHVPARLWHSLSREVPVGKTPARNGVYAKGGRNNRTLILANAVTFVENYRFIRGDRGRVRISCRQLARLLRVNIEDVTNAQFTITVNGPHSILVELNN